MKSSITILAFLFFAFTAQGQSKDTATAKIDWLKKQVVETACGQCKFGLKGKGCNLAIRVDGKAYFVDGTDIDSHGDAHAKDGFCNAVRQAEVVGEIINSRYRVSYFKLLKP